ncbi:hypothetical protein EMIHUDRAFT_237336 [Emiliania huxleyi CCMP1516]|uniref:Uncharacterized protein n=2 Tax=Emiliania huxleyi TaxID=2903 RepID=A0A0D3JQZ0_EMIH1|nr:hypothetical protein EMIHUDRAFT_237336 [Emiliania huxleyi CCMP1516]EOD25925.1 hypothetical protein EMIHUDRAFT_237336 [Emiliania huxleyi CCMP1516]|eukprot:XP_005778354.1 hypothetical protein EMIHUDRAFT_237336 [Emiliania huxleyi CCMP1516]
MATMPAAEAAADHVPAVQAPVDPLAWLSGLLEEKNRLAIANDDLRAQHATLAAEADRLRAERNAAVETHAQELKKRVAEFEDRDAKRRKLTVQQQYASALLGAVAEPKDRVLVRWPAGIVSVAKVLPAPAKAAPSLLHVECCITSDGDKIRDTVSPGAVEVVTKHNFERLLAELAASGSNTAEPEPDFLRRAIKQSTVDVKEGLPAACDLPIEGLASRAEQRLDAGGDATPPEVKLKVKVETSDSEEEQEPTVEQGPTVESS